jgi:hypothetical protein
LAEGEPGLASRRGAAPQGCGQRPPTVLPVVAKTRGGIVAVVGITVINEHIAEIDLILDADKLDSLTNQN